MATWKRVAIYYVSRLPGRINTCGKFLDCRVFKIACIPGFLASDNNVEG